ncbi:hypothetical protein QOL99_00165 [Deinococcus sp. MIMF12]|uniref:Uncharacterized protein n=1 Tax=Deinococcus rhizophilus TaxID=3049544 RepID=A0ABT7JBY8_9DEIO|nr:hypothetical protein [Deinococcus rhizophilus]MDL2342562.1 hypothetical protein [Deinococcus rhizophilus]
MTLPPAFTPWQAVSPDHNSGFFAIAPQAEPGVFVEPTLVMRETTGTGYLPDQDTIMPRFFNGTVFEPAGQSATGSYNSRTVTVELDAPTLAAVLRMMYGDGAEAAGVRTITPLSNRQWAAHYPAQAFSGYWYVPTIGYVKITNGQFYLVVATVPEDTGLVTAVLSFHAGDYEVHYANEAGFTVPAVAVPDFEGAFERGAFRLDVNGVEEAVEGGVTLTFNRPIDPGARSGNSTKSFRPGTGKVNIEVATSFTGGRPELLQLRDASTLVPLRFDLIQGNPAAGGVRITVNMPTAQYVEADAPISDGPVTTAVTLRAVIPNSAAKPFTVELEGDYAA